mmetsp:Transcript_26232/g.38874  ORF Transcript_26232/g.38874 Transcript_26232/m.38874 type:complete len:502 (+) Transcript_26232:84-1589(+)
MMNNFKIVTDVSKGRCLESTASFSVGDVIFEEDAILFGSADDDNDLVERNVYDFLSEYNPQQGISLDDICNFAFDLSKMDRVESLDSVRCFLQAVVYVLRFSKLSDDVNTPSSLKVQLELLNQLQPSSQAHFEKVVTKVRKKHKKVIPSSISNSLAGRLLGVVCNNQMELDQYGGSAVFPTCAITEHSCTPNCSFSTRSPTDSNHRVIITAVKDIVPGDRLSIDYGNNFYHSRRVRVTHLRNVYGFECSCPLCAIPPSVPLVDHFRVFTCLSCGTGKACIVYSQGTDSPVAVDGEEDEEVMISCVCQDCGWTADEDQTATFIALEEDLCDNQPENWPEYQVWLRSVTSTGLVGCTMHGHHYMRFWLEDDMGMCATEEAEMLEGQNAVEFYDRAVDIFSELVMKMDSNPGVPEVHSEKVIYRDRIGQLLIAAADACNVMGDGDKRENYLKRAQELFTEAFQISVLCAGILAPNTQQLKVLAESTPSTVSELRAHYNKYLPRR